MTALSIRMLRANIWVVAVALFAVSLQVLTTIKLGSTSLRISSSDLFLPVLALMLIVKWTRDGAPRPEWRLRYFGSWLAVLTLWMGVSLVNGRLHIGDWQVWALVNKGVGWPILLAYLLVGGWMGAFLEIRIRDAFLRSAMLFAWILCAVLLVLYSLALYRLIPSTGSSLYYPRITGFFANPNAFGIAMATMAALFAPFLMRATLFPARLSYLGMTLLCAAIVLAGSRSAWLGSAVAAGAFVLMKVLPWRDLIRVGGATIVLVLAVLHGPGIADEAIILVQETVDSVVQLAQGNKDTRRSPSDEANTPKARTPIKRSTPYLDTTMNRPTDPGIGARIASTRAALRAWRKAPILGIGIGTYYQVNKDVPNVAGTIHNTFLWLLAETGIVGAGLFSGFFLAVLLALLRCARAPPAGDPFLWGTVGVLLVFAGASVGTEILYQRYFWFLLGLALAVPYRPGREHEAVETGSSDSARRTQVHTSVR